MESQAKSMEWHDFVQWGTLSTPFPRADRSLASALDASIRPGTTLPLTQVLQQMSSCRVMPLFRAGIYITAAPACCWLTGQPGNHQWVHNSQIPGFSRSAASAFACRDVTALMQQRTAMAGLHSSFPQWLGSSRKMNSKPAALAKFLDHSLVTLTGCLLPLN